MSNLNLNIRPMPLFDTYESFQESSAREYIADRPAIVEYINRFSPAIDSIGDYQHVRAFLKSYSGVRTTFNNYRTQVERLMLWAWIKAGKSVIDLRRSDVEAFMDFSRSPDATWIGTSIPKRFIEKDGLFEPNEAWAPFTIKVDKSSRKVAAEACADTPTGEFGRSQGTVAQVFAICSSFYDFLVHEDVVPGNVFKAIKQKSKWTRRSMHVAQGKSLTHLQWDVVVETAERMANEDPKHERTLFIVVTIFAMYLRVSDIVGNPNWKPTMGSFIQVDDSWWYEAIRKGNVQSRIAVKPDYLQYLTRYRKSRGLSALPYPGENTQLLAKMKGKGTLSDRHVRNIVQSVFDEAFRVMVSEGRTEAEIASLRSASLHWLRHTGATFDAPYRDAKHLQADLAHKSLSTTQNTYYNSINEERSDSVQGLKIRS